MEGGEVAQAAEGIGAIWPIVITAVLSVIATLGTTWFGHWLGLSKDRELRDEEIKESPMLDSALGPSSREH